jgi:cytochrome P450
MPQLVSEADLPFYDGMAYTDRAEGRRVLAELRREHWLARTPLGHLVLRYDDSVAILRDRRWHSAVAILAEISGVTDPEFLQNRRQSILSSEGEVHARLKRLVAPAFTPRAADRFRPFMREVVESLVDPVAPTGRTELVGDVCEPYPIPIICELLGAPKEDWKLFSQWATDILRVFNFDLSNDLPLIKKAGAEMREYVGQLIEARRHDPRDDLLTDLIAAEEAGDRLSHDELVSMAEAVLIGGTDTTRNQLGCLVALFASHPDQWTRLAEQPELAKGAVEEGMRYLGAVRATGRFASEDIEHKGILFPAGTLVSPSFVAANFDPEVFEEPDRFDITRESAKPHLSFGSGIHYCLGSWLARAELQEALPILTRRMPDLALDGDVTWKPNGTGIWGPARLPLRFTPTP